MKRRLAALLAAVGLAGCATLVARSAPATAGAMRQWGHHATAFVGRRHLDDADLVERRLLIPALE